MEGLGYTEEMGFCGESSMSTGMEREKRRCMWSDQKTGGQSQPLPCRPLLGRGAQGLPQDSWPKGAWAACPHLRYTWWRAGHPAPAALALLGCGEGAELGRPLMALRKRAQGGSNGPVTGKTGSACPSIPGQPQTPQSQSAARQIQLDSWASGLYLRPQADAQNPIFDLSACSGED